MPVFSNFKCILALCFTNVWNHLSQVEMEADWSLKKPVICSAYWSNSFNDSFGFSLQAVWLTEVSVAAVLSTWYVTNHCFSWIRPLKIAGVSTLKHRGESIKLSKNCNNFNHLSPAMNTLFFFFVVCILPLAIEGIEQKLLLIPKGGCFQLAGIDSHL